MCELSAQAYRDSFDSPYRFAPWVHLKVEVSPGEFSQSGIGALCVYDKARIDVPFYIRTQDLAKLSEDQSFHLLGRIKGAPLKGCSMNFEKQTQLTTDKDSNTSDSTAIIFTPKKRTFDHENLISALISSRNLRNY